MLVCADARHHDTEDRTQVLGTFTGCFEEHAQAFVEKRKPRWRPL